MEPTHIPTASPNGSHAQHDPTPWTVEHTNSECPDLPYVMAAGEHWPIEVCVVYGTDRNAEANARFIVRAVNTHATLLAALKECAQVAGSAGHANAAEACHDIIATVHAAIADAERA